MQFGTNWWGDQQLASFRLKLGFVISCLIQPWQCRPLEGYHYQSRCTRGAIPLVEPAWLIIVGNNRPVMRLITADEAALRQRGQLPADKGRPSQPLTIQYKSQQGEATPTDIPIKRLSGLFFAIQPLLFAPISEPRAGLSLPPSTRLQGFVVVCQVVADLEGGQRQPVYIEKNK